MLKRSFEFEPWESGICDVYVRGVKVISGHNATLGTVALKVPADVKDSEVQIEPHDPRKALERVEDDNGVLVLPAKKGASPEKQVEQVSKLVKGLEAQSKVQFSDEAKVEKVDRKVSE